MLGQVSLLITCIFLLVVLRDKEFPLIFFAVLIAIALSKPQLAVLALPSFIYHKIKEDGAKEAIKFTTFIIATSLILTIPLFIASQNWFSDFLAQTQRNPFWAHPSSMNALKHFMPKYGEGVWVLLVVIILCFNIYLWNIKPKQEAILWSLALTPLITPYIWSWDFVMMFPLFIYSILKAKSQISLAFLYIGYFICCIVISTMKLHGAFNDFFYWWTPWYFIALVLIIRYIENVAKEKLGAITINRR
jgi:uncharacterized membrane protein